MALALETTGTTQLIVDERSAEYELAGLLAHRYGDGLVYMQGRHDHELLDQARQLGLVCDEGYLTPTGFEFCEHNGDYEEQY